MKLSWRGGAGGDPKGAPAADTGIPDGDVRLQGQWTGGSKWATRGATGLLWSALVCGPVGLMVGGVAFLSAPTSASAQTEQVADTASEQIAAELRSRGQQVAVVHRDLGRDRAQAPLIG